MTKAERKLLLLIATALANLLIWKNVDGREEAYGILNLVDAINKETKNVITE